MIDAFSTAIRLRSKSFGGQVPQTRRSFSEGGTGSHFAGKRYVTGATGTNPSATAAQPISPGSAQVIKNVGMPASSFW